MKLAEISKKKNFLDTLKNPKAAHIRKKIKEFRKAVGEWNWKVSSKYDKNIGLFTINVRAPHDYLDIIFDRKPDNKLQVFDQIDKIFPSDKYKINMWGKEVARITFWVSEDF